MWIHIQTGSIDSQIIKPVSAVTPLIVSAGTNNSSTPVLDVMNEISGPAHLFRVYPNGVIKLGGLLPRLVLGVSDSDPSNADNVDDGAILIQNTSNNVFFKSDSSYRKINSEECISFSIYLNSVTPLSTVDLADFIVPSNKSLVIKSIGSLLPDPDITINIQNVTDSTSVASTVTVSTIVNQVVISQKNIKFQVVNSSNSSKSASVVIKYEFI